MLHVIGEVVIVAEANDDCPMRAIDLPVSVNDLVFHEISDTGRTLERWIHNDVLCQVNDPFLEQNVHLFALGQHLNFLSVGAGVEHISESGLQLTRAWVLLCMLTNHGLHVSG